MKKKSGKETPAKLTVDHEVAKKLKKLKVKADIKAGTTRRYT